MKPVTVFRYLWALPNTLLGLLLLVPALLSGGRVKLVDGVLEISGRAVVWVLERIPFAGPADALTLGHAVLGRSEEILEQWRRHEQVHVRQYERWGPFFIPAYAFSSLYARMKGRDGYLGNRFETEAFMGEKDVIT